MVDVVRVIGSVGMLEGGLGLVVWACSAILMSWKLYRGLRVCIV
jgi:hypothetical protein